MNIRPWIAQAIHGVLVCRSIIYYALLTGRTVSDSIMLMYKKYRNQLGQLGKQLLLIMADLGELVDDAVFSPGKRLSISNMHKPNYYTTLARLEKRGLVRKKRKSQKIGYMITPLGRQLLQISRPAPRRSDGLSTIIMFDIPEEKGRERTIFRRFLLRNGYTQFQESVLISPSKINSEVMLIIRELGLKPFVTVFSGKIDYDL